MKYEDDNMDILLKRVLKSEESPGSDLLTKLKYDIIKEERKMENPIQKCKLPRTAVIPILITIVIGSFVIGFASGNRIIKRIDSKKAEQEIDNPESNFVSSDTKVNPVPIEIQDGRIYFTLDGSYTDITDQCTEELSYCYDSIDSKGYRHRVLVVRKQDGIRIEEYVWEPSGETMVGKISYQYGQEPPWTILGKSVIAIE